MSKDQKNPAVDIQHAARLSGLTVSMITYLSRVDILKPSRGGGRGSVRLFTFNDVLFLKVIADLLARGIEVSRLRTALKRARAEAQTWIDIRRAPRRYLVTDGTELFVRRRGKLESKTKSGQLAFAFVLDLAPTHKKIAGEWPAEIRSAKPSPLRASL
jgi:DNA-binding transcriptional MerR regulator